jgi:hypothetical protein
MKKALASLGFAAALAFGGTVLSATPFTPAPQAAEASTLSQCFVAMNGQRWCYKSNCNWLEYTFNNCRDGWVMTNVWYARGLPAPKAVLTSA